ncbi:Rhamnolipids biosynthesis 3-oxoacyl-[acyl-carrier-protein] reductase [Trametes pubescens]|uniref:Rhamnolipids biosynthesis 3-oxoacyl-[acyl-carrier-protein] reductase n=1 Tax=Trametes pubescens TaxID=154538 RepID=A0A1M2V3P3_TRAPU|nr:Rhamnolipids biosynthesis 3-oxoacyl-[acyl-carrier-protein] reductase [Trametes pubescens]
MPSACDNVKGLADTPTLFGVDGLVAVVTGGGTGIGLMIAKALEHNGAVVYIVGRRLQVLEEAAREHSRRGSLIPLQGDVTSRESMQAVAETIRQKHGYVNLLVNNAGLAKSFLPKLPGPGEVDMKKYQELLWNAGSPREFSGAFDVNVTSAWYCAVAFLDLLDSANKRGNMPGVTSQIITVSSGGAFRKDDKVFSVPYTLSKSAATHLGKMLAHFLKDWNIRSNIIAPGIFPSEMIEGLISQEYINAGVPLHRAGSIDDMGGLILFLASRAQAGAYMNGTVQLIDGGRLLLYPSTY